MAKHVYSIIPGWPWGINKSTADWGRGSIDFENDRNMTATGEQSFRKREVILWRPKECCLMAYPWECIMMIIFGQFPILNENLDIFIIDDKNE